MCFPADQNLCTPGVQGNCSSPNVATVAGLTLEERANLLPLKPRQCVVIVPGTFLTVEDGQVWLDNLYLMLPKTAPESFTAFVRTDNEQFCSNSTPAAPDLFISNATLHSQLRGAASGVLMTLGASRLFLQGADSETLRRLAAVHHD